MNDRLSVFYLSHCMFVFYTFCLFVCLCIYLFINLSNCLFGCFVFCCLFLFVSSLTLSLIVHYFAPCLSLLSSCKYFLTFLLMKKKKCNDKNIMT